MNSTKAKTKGKKKKAKEGAQSLTKSKKGKVEYRPLKPATAGMKIQNKVKPGKIKKMQKAREMQEEHPAKHMVHSKSERHLNVAEDVEEEKGTESQLQNESGASYGQDDHSEDQVMEPKEYPGQEGEEEPEETQNEEPQAEEEGMQEGEEEDQEEHEENRNETELEEKLRKIPDGNVFKILSENVMKVKENLRENREIQDIAFDDEKVLSLNYWTKLILYFRQQKLYSNRRININNI